MGSDCRGTKAQMVVGEGNLMKDKENMSERINHIHM